MVWDGFYSLGGTEFANEERFRTYLETVGSHLPMPLRDLVGYEDTHVALGDSPYTTPLQDRAPWVDVNDPLTHDLLGMTILSQSGLEGSVRGATTTESLGYGGTVGYARDGSREVRFTALIAGLSAEAAHAGVVWLHQLLWGQRGPRSLVPQIAGSADMRFFVDNPGIAPDQIVNFVANPDASGVAESLGGNPGGAYVFRVPTAADWAYRLQARTAAHAEGALLPAERPGTAPGDLWVARARVWRDASVLGPRVLQLLLRFRDQYGNLVYSVGANDTTVPEGVLYRWVGGRYDSKSQMLTPAGMVTNEIVNPSAEGIRLGFAGRNGAALALLQTTQLAGKKAYRWTAGTTGESVVESPGSAAVSGEQWWGRVRAKMLAGFGGRRFRADIGFFDAAGRALGAAAGTQANMLPGGTARRWLGTRFASSSQEVSGGTVRYNRNPNPSHRKDTAGYSGAGGASVGLERFTGLGMPNCILLTFPAANTFATGLNIPSEAKVGETVYVTFWALGANTLRLQGDGWTDLATGAVNPASGINFTISSSTPTRVSIGIKITKATQIIRVIRNGNAVTGTVRFARIGLMTDTDSYFDGDTGTYEWESTPSDSSSIAHLPGNYDLYNTPWNPGFENGIGRWNADNGTAITWAKAVQRMQVTLTGGRSSGNVLAKQDLWPYIAGGQRVGAGMKVFNLSGTAVSAAVRVVASGGGVYDGTTVSIPANGSAWLPLPTTGMPSGTSGAYPALVAKGVMAAGTVLQVDNVFFGTVPDGSTITEAAWYDGASASTNGAAFPTGQFDLVVGGIAPEGTASARLQLRRLASGPTETGDQLLFDSALFAQVDAVDPGNPTPDPATLPAYFDGDGVSTAFAIATAQVNSAVAAGTADTTQYDLVVTGAAPDGAVTAEIAFARAATIDSTPAAGDLVFADNLLLTRYEDGDPVPDYTDVTLRSLVSRSQRWVQDVYPTAGPTVLEDIDLDGCGGVAKRVEFTVVAERPTWLRDPQVQIPLPMPSNVNQGSLGAGAFAKYDESARGVVRNFMPQFSMSSPIVPNSWVTTYSGGTGLIGGYRPPDDSTQPYVLRVAPTGDAPRFTTRITAIEPLGPRGGADGYSLSVMLGVGKVGATLRVTAELLNGSTVLATQSQNYTGTSVSDGTVLSTGDRVDFQFANTFAAGVQADGARLSITSTSATGSVYIGIPQLTLGSAPFPLIFGGLPDDGTYTYAFDGGGFSTRTPVVQQNSETVFPNLTAPPIAPSTIDGYNEVGLTSIRTFAAIPAEVVPANSAAVPVLRLDFDRLMTRQARIRFYPNPMNVAPETINPSTFEHEWVVTPFHANTRDYATTGFMSLVIDAASEAVWMRAFDGTVIPGDQYVVTSDGSPVTWPEFRGVPWVVSVDYPTFRQFAEQPALETWWRPTLALIVEE